MNAQKKAEELVRKYYTWGINKEGQTLSWFEAKQCALIAVDEIMQTMNDVMFPNPFRQYWNKVKQEIEAL